MTQFEAFLILQVLKVLQSAPEFRQLPPFRGANKPPFFLPVSGIRLNPIASFKTNTDAG